MSRIDLDDLPPRIAQVLASLREGEELTLVRGGAVVGRLALAEVRPAATEAPPADLTPEGEVAEVLEHFSAIVNDAF